MREISLHGQNKRYSHNQLGLNGRLDTIQAAVLLAKLNLFDNEVENRKTIGFRYTKKLNAAGFLNTPFISEENTSVFAQYTIQVDNREKVINELKSKGIPTSVHYPTLLSDQKALNKPKKGSNLFFNKILNRNIFKSHKINHAKNISSKVLSLPMHPMLSEDDQNLIIDSLINVLNLVN